ncbi:MAG: SCP-like extracellular [Deltaproteobacteria bacterium]|jgi:pathogenesis-related protein 1|nr:SCP-like extracellular [Deltaproteobacteria bacterium]MBW2532839.1 SCP-like extracellular [Deltaproteobacteria bacterium]
MSGMTAAHNQERCDVGANPAIPPLSWSNSLASVAQSWADYLASQGCPLQHSSSGYGENIFWGSGSSYSAQYVHDAWASEISCFTYGTFPGCCSCTCGHYTQIVWRNTTQLGCAKANCPGSGQIWVCNYNPPGNYLGQMPY